MDVLLLAACIRDKLHLKTNASVLDCVTPAVYIKIKLRFYIRNRRGCVTPGGLHPKQAAFEYTQEVSV